MNRISNGLGGLVRRIALAVLLAALPGGVALAQDEFIVIGGDTVEPLVLTPGFTLTVEVDKEYADIVVGNAGVADVFPLTTRSIYIQANSAGATNISFYNAEKGLIGTIIVNVRIDFGELQEAIDSAVPSARVDVSNVNNRIRLSGEVRDNVDLQRVLDIAMQYAAGEDQVVNAIRVTDPQQVQLDVRILEVTRTASRSLGVNLTAQDGSMTTGDKTSPVPFGSFVGTLLTNSGPSIDVVINALEGKGLARRLANPSLITSNGVEANFTVGGEVPIQMATTGENGSVATSTGYREYGVRLNFKPIVLDNSMISLRVRPEVSDVDLSVTKVSSAPAFITRKADTTVSLRDGQSFAIAGLLQVDNERSAEQLPWLGQVPILGAMFRSSGFQKQETDLVIVVTPRLVEPGTPAQPAYTPLDDTRSSNDVEMFLLGMLEVDRRMIRGFAEGAGVSGPYGHIIDVEFSDALIDKQ